MKKYPKYKRKYLDQRCDYSLDLPNDMGAPDIIIVIPAYNESANDVEQCFDSLAANVFEVGLEAMVILLINYPEDSTHEIKVQSLALQKELQASLQEWNRSQLSFLVYAQEMKIGESGVGWARKKLMDLACRILDKNETEGIIVNLDADCVVDQNYCSEIHNYFSEHWNMEAVSISFSHPLNGTDPSEYAIIQYELHLRYFINMQRILGLPCAFQTVGSSMAVRSESYMQNGGMNKRKAGEDFYFLHKYTKRLSIGELSTTEVKASPRRSERVPFGTGKAVGTILDADEMSFLTYNPNSFAVIDDFIGISLKVLLEVENLDFFQQKMSNSPLLAFEKEQSTFLNLREIIDRTKVVKERIKVFFNWFDAFKLMKALHFIRDSASFDDRPIQAAVCYIFSELDLVYDEKDLGSNLKVFRDFDRKDTYRHNWREILLTRHNLFQFL